MKKKFLQPRAAPVPADSSRAARYEDGRYARERARGFPWLRFGLELESEYRASSRGRSAAHVRLVCGASLLGLSAFLLFGQFHGLEGFALAFAVLLGWIGLYLTARESRHSFLVEGELRQQAHVDVLTGAMNRRAFHDHLNVIWRQAERAGVAVGLMLLDLDHFKAVNDRHGHQAGDIALRSTAEILKSYALRPLDAVGRYGGDEFIVVWYDAHPAAFASLIQLLPAKLWMGLAATQVREANMTVSGGAVMVRPGVDSSIENAISSADEELYKVKRSCRGVIALRASAPAVVTQQDLPLYANSAQR